MSFGKEDFHCLNVISDDYEEIPHIRECLMRWNKIDLSEQDILHSMYRLIEAGLAQAYRYDANLGDYLKVRRESATLKDWYYITKQGGEALKGSDLS